MFDHVHHILRPSKLNTEALGKFKRPQLLTRMHDRGPRYIETLEIEQQKLLRNSNGYNFSLGCLITRIIYRDPRNWTRKHSANSNGHNLWLECMIDVHEILRRSKLNNRSSQETKMPITFISDVRFMCITYRDPRNWTRKLTVYSNGHNFLL